MINALNVNTSNATMERIRKITPGSAFVPEDATAFSSFLAAGAGAGVGVAAGFAAVALDGVTAGAGFFNAAGFFKDRAKPFFFGASSPGASL